MIIKREELRSKQVQDIAKVFVENTKTILEANKILKLDYNNN